MLSWCVKGEISKKRGARVALISRHALSGFRDWHQKVPLLMPLTCQAADLIDWLQVCR